ncbi:ABC transporter ATP-binding protein [Pedobacter sp. KR3-3]|uniref:ABC transporter ATP-binding protein n=1 Tax=Pedobacter albus TaxID=3113905 RepID=A0ABU7I707_9SPHI|nr:ABC transporter ATP-binding protein [Pedobacter sp. KR3-3]MEE1945126.1 ABC transporter ATP-binding protein [Pedobacter sp. KR3-3]
MSNIAIKVENLSKAYQLGQIGTGTISRDLERWFARVRGKEDPFLKIGETNEQHTKSTSDIVWSLRDINFEIEQGDAVGIIGRNGAGKSTLLKILSKITAPTTGKISGHGRIASLLEVGTGFHPELSGRENIFLNGAILGMRKKEIKRKLDEIVDFAGIARYLDTPVKRYSSGMYVRLAFAVAAHLESEILIVDEVLAVGDAEFQKKCLGKMGEVSKGEGRTVLFVSHNMLAVNSLCNTGILLKNGTLQQKGDIADIITQYVTDVKSATYKDVKVEQNNFTIDTIHIHQDTIQGEENENLEITLDTTICIKTHSHLDFERINVNLFFKTTEGIVVFATCSAAEPYYKGQNTYNCVIPANIFNDNVYTIDLMVVDHNSNALVEISELISIEFTEAKRQGSWMGKFPGLMRPAFFDWEKTHVSYDNI